MLRGLLKLTWVEIKIFLREPMGVVGTVAIPVVVFLVLRRIFGEERTEGAATVARSLPALVVLLIAIGGVLSLITIVGIYREGGILKRLRATPLTPLTILTTHVLVKLALSVATLGLLAVAGRRLFAGYTPASPAAFFLATVLSLVSVLSMGFVLASLVATARFAQPLASVILYPLLVLSGVLFPLDVLPPAARSASQLSPITHAADLIQGSWEGRPLSTLWLPAAVLFLNFAVCAFLAGRFFRWE